jgi:hypothetical protein
MSPTIRVDAGVYGALQLLAEPFVDTPNDVLRKLLKLDDAKSIRTEGSSDNGRPITSIAAARSPKGKDTTQRAYREPILQALEDLGGRGTVKEIMATVERLMSAKFTTGDHEPVPSGAVRWLVTAKFELSKMTAEGLLVRVSWGTYQLSDAGHVRHGSG